MRLFHEIPIFQTVKFKVIILLFETVRLSVSISPRHLYNSLKSIKERAVLPVQQEDLHMLHAERLFLSIHLCTVSVNPSDSQGLTILHLELYYTGLCDLQVPHDDTYVIAYRIYSVTRQITPTDQSKQST